jgi:hypothetical protein
MRALGRDDTKLAISVLFLAEREQTQQTRDLGVERACACPSRTSRWCCARCMLRTRGALTVLRRVRLRRRLAPAVACAWRGGIARAGAEIEARCPLSRVVPAPSVGVVLSVRRLCAGVSIALLVAGGGVPCPPRAGSAQASAHHAGGDAHPCHEAPASLSAPCPCGCSREGTPVASGSATAGAALPPSSLALGWHHGSSSFPPDASRMPGAPAAAREKVPI